MSDLLLAVKEYLDEYELLREVKASGTFRKAFVDQLKKALNKVDKGMAKELGAGRLNMNDVRRAERAVQDVFEKTKDEFTRAYTEFTFKAANAGRNSAIRQFGLGLDLNIVNEQVQSQLVAHAFKASEHTMARMAGDVMKTLTKCHREGLSIFEIRKSLSQDFDGMKAFELDRISRTELHSASQKGASLAYSEAGVEYEEWVTALDDRVRGTPGGKWEDVESDHSEMHGQIVRTGTPFRHPGEGWEVMFPGDRNTGAPISAWIQCRCQLVPFWLPKGKAAPENMEQFYRDDLIDAPVMEEEAAGNIVATAYGPTQAVQEELEEKEVIP